MTNDVRLTTQEKEILQLRINGNSLAAVAALLRVSKTTVIRWERVAMRKAAVLADIRYETFKSLYSRVVKLYGGGML